ncbi:hypothetical protein [Bacillus taeanensis]|uniref:IDEAL domain-containing protein n=1 Tax=Bacillus taeanensis TaxID=273032 RepID=A0A366XUD1_9BACI|nr:hypothetical protein [Bacillus taeanensis]RBW69266.1 hypothetical protein DS031_12875 [Bacillus taeanensis]
MKVCYPLRVGKIVKVINEELPICGEICEIKDKQKNGQFLIKSADGLTFSVNKSDVAPWLTSKQEMALYEAQLFQLQLLAVEINDHHWFDEIGKMLSELKVKQNNY